MADRVEDDEARGEVVGRDAVWDGWWIVGDASDGTWEEGMAIMAVPSSFEDGFGVYDDYGNHEEAWW